MPWTRRDASLLVLGEAPSTATLADELRACGFRVTVASTLSEVRDLMASAAWPTLVVVDARVGNPWRADALQRMTALVGTTATATLRIGGATDDEARAGDEARALPADASVATIVAAVCALHDGGPAQHRSRASSQSDLVDA